MKLTSGLIILLFGFATIKAHAGKDCHSLLNFEAKKLRSSESINFCEQFAGKAVLIVNTASQCGYTSQFSGLEKLHTTYGNKLAVIGFPSNDFKQEFAESEKVADVCYVNYGVTFTMVEPSSVTGEGANMLYKALMQRTGRKPAWNFNKYLVSPDGETIKHFSSNTKPMSDELQSAIASVLVAQ